MGIPKTTKIGPKYLTYPPQNPAITFPFYFQTNASRLQLNVN